MRFPLSQTIRRLARFTSYAALGLATVVVCSTASAQQRQTTVLSMSPSGSSSASLSWKRPAQEVTSFYFGTEPQTVSEPMVLPEEAVREVAVQHPKAEIATSAPIRPVQLLQAETAENKSSSIPLAAAPSRLPDTAETQGADVAQVYREYGISPNSLGPNSGEEAYVDECPDPKSLSSILELSYKVTPKPGLFPESCPLPDEVYYREAPTPITFTWKASALCHKPAYFEDVQLERYGHTCCPILQPAVSYGRFLGTILILPYLMGVNPPNECIYDLGYYRPGNCAPYMLEPLPISLRGGLMQAGVVVGGVALIP